MADFYAVKEQGDQCFANGDLEEALAFYDQAIEERPQFWAAHFEKGRVLYELGDFVRAASCFSVASLYGRRHPAAQLMCARSLTMGNFTTEACQVFAEIPFEKIDDTSLVFYAKALQIEGQHDEAKKVLPSKIPNEAPIAWLRVRSALLEQDDHLSQAGECLLELKRYGAWGLTDVQNLAGIKGNQQNVDGAVALLADSCTQIMSGEVMPQVSLKEQKGFDTETALTVLETIMLKLGSKRDYCFVAFGTLLGLHREDALLGHDKDMDIGVLPGCTTDDIKRVFDSLPQFFVKTTSQARDDYNIVIKDIASGIVCDFFFFSETKEGYEGGLYHPVGPITWTFSPFSIIQKTLGGMTLPVPDNIEQHLAEVYGPGWIHPEPLFDTVVHGTNLNSESKRTRYLFAYSRMHKALCNQKFEKAAMYARYLIKEHGEANLKTMEEAMIEKARAIHK